MAENLCLFGIPAHLLSTTVADSNASVQEKELDALIAFLQAADRDLDLGRNYAKQVCTALAEKCLTGPSTTVEKAKEAFLLWVELEAVDAVLDALEKATNDATLVVPALAVISEALGAFGSKIIPPLRIINILPRFLYHQDHIVCASAKRLALQLCYWEGFHTVAKNMIENMGRELEAVAEFDSIKLFPTRKIRSKALANAPEPEEKRKAKEEAAKEAAKEEAAKEEAAKEDAAKEDAAKEVAETT